MVPRETSPSVSESVPRFETQSDDSRHPEPVRDPVDPDAELRALAAKCIVEGNYDRAEALLAVLRATPKLAPVLKLTGRKETL